MRMEFVPPPVKLTSLCELSVVSKQFGFKLLDLLWLGSHLFQNILPSDLYSELLADDSQRR